MQLLFKTTSSQPHTPTEVGDTDFMAHYTGVNHSMAWDELTPGIRQATEKYVLDFVGLDVYDTLATHYQADSGSLFEKRAIELLQDCIAYYTAYHVMPEKTAYFTSSGVNQNSSTDGSGQPASQWGWKNKRWSALENGDSFLDRLLTLLEKNPIEFPYWAASSQSGASASGYFRTTADLNAIIDIKGSRRTYLTLLRYLRNVESDLMEKVFCELNDELVLQIKMGNLTDANKTLVRRARKAIAFAALFEAIPNHRLVIEHDGFKFVSQGDQFDDKRNMTNPNHANAIDSLRDDADRKARLYMTELTTFLKKNKADYSTWVLSPCYSAEGKPAGHSIVVSRDGRGGVGIF